MPCLLLPPWLLLSLPPFASATSPIRYPRPLLSPLWLPSVHATPTPPRRRQRPPPSSLASPFVACSHPPPPSSSLLCLSTLSLLFLLRSSSPSVSRVSFSFSSTSSHHHRPVEKLTRVAGQRIRNYDLSRRRDYLLSRRLWNPSRALHPHRVRSTASNCRFPLALFPFLSFSVCALRTPMRRLGVFLVNLSRTPIMRGVRTLVSI